MERFGSVSKVHMKCTQREDGESEGKQVSFTTPCGTGNAPDF